MGIPITYFRSSSYNQWDMCQQCYFLEYTLGIKGPSGKKAEMGTIFHKVMECLARTKLCIQNGETVFEDDAVGELKAREDTLMTAPYWERIFSLAFAHYAMRSVHKFSMADRRQIATWIADTLDFQNGMFDPRRRTIVAAEPHFDIEFTEPWAHYNFGDGLEGQLRLKGTIDLVTKINDNTYEVVDWKTGKRSDWATGKEKDFKALTHDPQLLIYYYAITQMYPHVDNVVMSINFIKFNEPFTVAYDKSDIVIVKNMLRKRFETIKACTRPHLKSNTGSHWFCQRVCPHLKTPHPKDGTKCVCHYIRDAIKKHGINNVIQNEKADGHQHDSYKNPGE